MSTQLSLLILLLTSHMFFMISLFRKNIVYSPDNDQTITSLMKNVEETLGPNMASFTAVADENEILRHYEANFSTVYMGIVFTNTTGKDLRYKSVLIPTHLNIVSNIKVQDPNDVGRIWAQLPDAWT